MRKQMIAISAPLPPGYRRKDFLAFHSRDAQRVAETTTARGLQKGVVWQGLPARLRIVFRKDAMDAGLALDGQAPAGGEERFAAAVRHMLGLSQPVDVFETAHAHHPLLGTLVASNPGLRVMQTASPFEALCWAVIGQQVSVHAAVSIRRRFILAAGIRHSGGLWCFPDAGRVAAMTVEELRASGLSQTKAVSLRALSAEAASGNLPLDAWSGQLQQGLVSAERIRERLTAIRGVGAWTANYALLRGFGHLDGSLHGDVAVRRNLARLLGSEEKITEKQTEQWLAPFSPWRALVAAHLWALQTRDGF